MAIQDDCQEHIVILGGDVAGQKGRSGSTGKNGNANAQMDDWKKGGNGTKDGIHKKDIWLGPNKKCSTTMQNEMVGNMYIEERTQT